MSLHGEQKEKDVCLCLWARSLALLQCKLLWTLCRSSVSGLLFCSFGKKRNNDTNNSRHCILFLSLWLWALLHLDTLFFFLFTFPLFPFFSFPPSFLSFCSLLLPLAIDLPEPPVLWVTEVTETSIKLKWDQRRNPSDLTRKSISHPTSFSFFCSFFFFFPLKKPACVFLWSLYFTLLYFTLLCFFTLLTKLPLGREEKRRKCVSAFTFLFTRVLVLFYP